MSLAKSQLPVFVGMLDTSIKENNFPATKSILQVARKAYDVEEFLELRRIGMTPHQKTSNSYRKWKEAIVAILNNEPNKKATRRKIERVLQSYFTDKTPQIISQAISGTLHFYRSELVAEGGNIKLIA